MKVRLKRDLKIVDVTPGANGWFLSIKEGVAYKKEEFEIIEEETGPSLSEWEKEMNKPRPIYIQDPWEERRFQIAKSVIAGIAANKNSTDLSTDHVVKLTLEITDKLIEQLKSDNHEQPGIT